MTPQRPLETLKRSACLVGIVFALSACATTETSTAADAMSVKSAENTAMADETKTASADDKQICKRTRVVGSKFYKKVCATEAQWAARAEADRKTTEDIQRAKAPGVSN